jgi:hypothetical protein
MLELLLVVCVLGVIAWVINSIPMPAPFQTIAYAILIVILLIVLFRVVSGGDGLNLRIL